MKTKIALLLQVVCFSLFCFGLSSHEVQAHTWVGQSSDSPDRSASLSVSDGPFSAGSPYRGILSAQVALNQTSSTSPVMFPVAGLLMNNTGQTQNVAVGYYYWEDSKWIRLSKFSNSTSAREAAVGAPIPAYTYSEAKALTTAPGDVFILKEPGQEGLFRNANTPLNPQDTLSPNGIRDTNGNIIASGTIMNVGGQRYMRVINDGIVNVKWFGAVGQSDATDDAPAIQRAINYAKFLVNRYGNVFNVATVLIPPGNFRIRKTLDLTKCKGIVIKGSGGGYMNSTLIGNTGGLMLDFTDSFASGCENLFILSIASEPNYSTIGAQFALGTTGNGVGCLLKNCFIVMADVPSANNGLGTIGIMNCRAEEFAVTDCRIQANIGCIFSYKNDLSDVSLAYTVSSSYATVVTGQGSMGVVNFIGQNSIVNYGKVQPALILNGTNSFNFHGYLSRISSTGGTNESAILVTGPVTYNLTINGTVESFAQLLRVKSPLINSTINGVVANQENAGSSFPAGTTRHPVIDLSQGGQLQGCKVNITFGNGPAEIGSRYLLYDNGQPNNPNYPTAIVSNSEIISPQWSDNNFVISTNLFSNTDNSVFRTAYPFKVESGISKQLFLNPVSAGTAGTPITATVARWRTTNNQNIGARAGVYSVTVEGIIKAGTYGSGAQAMARFRGTISMAQQYLGTKSTSQSTMTILDQTTTEPAYINIRGAILSLDVSDPNIYKINITPTVAGSGTGEPITITAVCEVSSDFIVKGAIMFP